MRLALSALALFILMLVAVPAYPHGGGLDAYGCHNNRKAGGYHCHRGPFAGETFSSKDHMLERLKSTNGEDQKKRTKPPQK